MLSQTRDFREVRSIRNNLEFLMVVITSKMEEAYMLLVEDFYEANKVLENIKKCKKKINPIAYEMVIDTADIPEQAMQIF